MTIDQQYERASNSPSDINEHLPVLKEYAQKCQLVTEFGVRAVVSTWAFMAARPKRLHSYDITYHPNIEVVKIAARKESVDFDFILNDTRTVGILPTDFLFIDTLHTYEQLKAELALHHDKVSTYLGFHDTTTFENVDETGSGRGLWPAIQEFMDAHPEWSVDLRKTNNNGLTILRRQISS